MKKVSCIGFLIICTQLLWAQNGVLKEGHRGCRGLMPENTIAAMKKGLDLGVQVLELDVYISKDREVIVSHDPYLSAAIALKPSGDTISVEEQKNLLLYSLPYAEIKKFDVGSKHNVDFAQQQNFPAHIPLLSEPIVLRMPTPEKTTCRCPVIISK